MYSFARGKIKKKIRAADMQNVIILNFNLSDKVKTQLKFPYTNVTRNHVSSNETISELGNRYRRIKFLTYHTKISENSTGFFFNASLRDG